MVGESLEARVTFNVFDAPPQETRIIGLHFASDSMGLC